MDKKNGVVKEVIHLASRIATLRAEVARLNEEIDAHERTLESMLGSGSSRRGRKAATHSVRAETAAAPIKAPKSRSKARKGARSNKTRAKGKSPSRSGTIMEAIFEALAARRGEAMSVTSVADAVGANPASVATMLKRLVERGRITKPALGRYQAD